MDVLQVSNDPPPVPGDRIPNVLLLILSFLKLLINSREELSLAKVIGPESVLDHKIFTVIRKEAEKTKMPLYQTVV